MNRRSLLLFVFCSFLAGALGAQTLSLTATSIDGTAYYSNNRTAVWIDGSVTVTRSSTTVNPTYYTVDLAPNADMVGGTYPRNANWEYYATNGQHNTIYLDNAEIYTRSAHFINNSRVWKLWGASGIGDTSVVAKSVLSGSFTGTQTSITYPFAAVFWENGSLGTGFYELPLTFRLRNEQFVPNGVPTTEPIVTAPVMLRFIVGEYAVMFFKNQAGGSEIFSLNFDTVATGTQETFAIAIQSNFKYHLSIKSAYGQKLRHERYGAATSPVNEEIGYAFSYNGTTKTLPAGVVVRLESKQSANVSGTTYGTVTRDREMTLTLGTISDFTAGKYADTLSFIITSTN